jgi:hypothetical protein
MYEAAEEIRHFHVETKVLGMNVTEARKFAQSYGYTIHVDKADGDEFPCHKNIDTDRLHVVVENAKIVNVGYWI